MRGITAFRAKAHKESAKAAGIDYDQREKQKTLSIAEKVKKFRSPEEVLKHAATLEASHQ